jgi:NAD(P)-dependent dehydrogenase (short-subunit alcohol dehydrogenase family)
MWPNIKYDYNGCRVLVTGGTSGIGAGIAAAYREAGADVAITGTKPNAAAYDSADLKGYRYIQLDVEDNAAIDRVAAGEKQLDILVNNAGFALPSIGLDEYEPEIFERAIQMHLISAYRMARGCSGALSKSKIAGGGSIIGIASMASYFGIEIVPGYGAAKAGIVQMTKTLAVHWAKQNIRVNAVAAGLTASRMTAGTIANPEWSAPTLARTPLGRLGDPRDIAGAVLFLTSPAASWITGQTLPVDGGYTVVG